MATATVAHLDLYYDSFGSDSDPTLVLMAGLGSQLLNYPDELCLAFVDRGLRVVRFDHRDAGLSTHLTPGDEYTLDDMASDVIGLMAALDIPEWHLWGSSMGGMIAQLVAIREPAATRSLISVQSTTGEPGVGRPDPAVLDAIVAQASPATSRGEAIDRAVRLAELLINNPLNFDAAAQRAKAEVAYDRSYDPEGTGRQLAAVLSTPPRHEQLRSLPVPALVIHGNADPLIGIDGGRRTAELIPGATFLEVHGMGHDLTPCFWSQYVDAVIALVARVESGA